MNNSLPIIVEPKLGGELFKAFGTTASPALYIAMYMFAAL